MRSQRGLIALMTLLLLASNALSQEKLSDEEKKKRAAEAQALVSPGPEHKQLEQLAGTWDQDVKVWPQPGAQPINFKGRTTNRMVLGGRFLVSEGQSTWGTVTVDVLNILGFDRRYKRFTVVAYDTQGTYYVAAAGPYNEQRKAIVMYGEDQDPTLGTQKYDMVLRIESPDRYVIEIIFKDQAHTGGKGDFKLVEVTFTRAK